MQQRDMRAVHVLVMVICAGGGVKKSRMQWSVSAGVEMQRVAGKHDEVSKTELDARSKQAKPRLSPTCRNSVTNDSVQCLPPPRLPIRTLFDQTSTTTIHTLCTHLFGVPPAACCCSLVVRIGFSSCFRRFCPLPLALLATCFALLIAAFFRLSPLLFMARREVVVVGGSGEGYILNLAEQAPWLLEAARG